MHHSIQINKDWLGIDQHLIATSAGDIKFINEFDPMLWSWSCPSALRDLNSVVRATNTKVNDMPPRSHLTAWEQLGTRPRWSQALPAHVFKKWLKEFIGDLLMTVDKWDDSYYGKEFQIQQRLMQKLQQPFVDDVAIKTIADDRVDQFLSKGDGLAPRSTYDNTSSVTGRMSITNGPNILTLDRQYRKIFKSRHSEGRIIQVDFTSLEPCVCLAVQGKKFEGDAYHWAQKALNGQVSRDIVKVATMSALYGMTPSRFAKKFSDVPDAADLLFNIRDAFGVDALDRRLKEMHNNVGHIKNYYGRIITVDKTSPYVAYYVQSTAVDVVCQGFTSLINQIEMQDIDAVPLYLIHDALMFDVTHLAEKKLIDICNNGIYIPSLDCTFPVKIKTIDA